MLYILMGIVGAVMGSFLCCQARRLRLRELGKPGLGKWSVCPKCGKKLKWYENVPVLSWVVLRGKCRKCGSKIGAAEILAEVGGLVAVAMLASTIDPVLANGWEWAIWAFVVVFSWILEFLAIYDGLYGELPTKYLTFLIICAILIVILRQWSLISVGAFEGLGVELGGAALLGGIYLVLYIVSKGNWVGDGDWLLAAAIGAVVGSPWLALGVLLVANLSACVVMLPQVLKSKNHTIYFGPFLALGWIIIYTFGEFLTNLI